MNKVELVRGVKSKLNEEISLKAISEILDAAFDVISDEVASGEKVQLLGFGTFEPRQRKEKEGRNPKTGEKMVIPSKIVPAFKPGKAFKDRVSK